MTNVLKPRFQPNRLFAVFVLFVLFVLLPTRTWAADFSSSYNTTYDFLEDGTAQVIQNITLTNHTADKYPADYTLTLEKLNTEEITAFDDLGPLELELRIEKEKETKIKVFFNQKAVGVGSQLSWTLKYKLSNFAKKNGRMWEVSIPLIVNQIEDNRNQLDIENYAVSVKIPQSFGPEHLVKPSQSQKLKDDTGKTTYQFNPEPRATLGFRAGNLTLSFGDFQLYDFSLTYHLQNPTVQIVSTEIALPPDFYPYQRVYFKSLEPKPLKIREDADGNFLAEYKLSAKQNLDVIYKGQFKILANFPTSNFPALPVGRQLLTVSLQPYLLPAKFWETNDQKIKEQKEKVGKLYNLTDESSQTDWAKAIYDYVTVSLKYNPNRITPEIERYGAIKALQDPQNAVCMEYTDLMITLLRAVGIPARELDGFAMTEKDPEKPLLADSLHSWVQFFDADQGIWINTDPTWGSTTGQDFFLTLDTNHLIFVIKGLDSERPYPAGSYKITGEEQGDVQIEYAQNFEQGVIPFKLWWQKNFETSRFSLLDKIYLWLSSLAHNSFR